MIIDHTMCLVVTSVANSATSIVSTKLPGFADCVRFLHTHVEALQGSSARHTFYSKASCITHARVQCHVGADSSTSKAAWPIADFNWRILAGAGAAQLLFAGDAHALFGGGKKEEAGKDIDIDVITNIGLSALMGFCAAKALKARHSPSAPLLPAKHDCVHRQNIKQCTRLLRMLCGRALAVRYERRCRHLQPITIYLPRDSSSPQQECSACRW